MSDLATLSPYGVRTETTTVRMQRLLPGPIERVWAYLTESDLRRQWLASGPMELKAGGHVELTWRNSELTPHEEERPEGMRAEHSMESRITRLDPPRLLAFTWGEGEVTFELEPQGAEILLTVTHRRLIERSALLNVSAGWHAHLDLLADRLSNREPGPFWRHWSELKAEYEARLPE
ncbi:SRPBCC family protein [Phenylobacterium aquaticum]|uniref:SRPBCC family protein n=1 Tax=Phenylobacterium aquaticum TaxID=1763816 RepID=UPI001F5D502A|nr:SRPBCC family protein [Phenylobacterium aquaticum]MCI3133621.1 SRPBCC family protein [Phenylobacterium aquaticum]